MCHGYATLENSVPSAPLRDAYFRAMAMGVSASEMAEGMGWTKKNGNSGSGRCGDVSRLYRLLGLQADMKGGLLLEKRVSYENAVRFARALDQCEGFRLDPHEVGV